jgi:hypothetical protein
MHLGQPICIQAIPYPVHSSRPTHIQTFRPA